MQIVVYASDVHKKAGNYEKSCCYWFIAIKIIKLIVMSGKKIT